MGLRQMSFHMTKRSQLRRQDPDDLVPADCRQSPQRFQKHRPKTDKGKQRSRGNALRHGLTAETVIGTLEASRRPWQRISMPICG
jgi:hypothetical protein